MSPSRSSHPKPVEPVHTEILSRNTRRKARFSVLPHETDALRAILEWQDYGQPIRRFEATREELADMLATLQAALLRK